jgi:hypothetical protein
MAATRQSPWIGREREVELALSEGWNWLVVQGLLVPASGMNGRNGWYVISRRGQTINTDEDFEHFKEAAAFPKSMLHHAIADKVWLNLARGDLADAVFVAFRTVEEAVRAAGGSPRCQRSHNSVFSAAVKPRRNLCLITTHSIFTFKIKCCVDQLRSPTHYGLNSDIALLPGWANYPTPVVYGWFVEIT